MEKIRIVADRIEPSPELRDVSKPENTTFKSERYFQETRKLKNGEIYVSHVTGCMLRERNSLQALLASRKPWKVRSTDGVIRFATPCIGDDGVNSRGWLSFHWITGI